MDPFPDSRSDAIGRTAPSGPGGSSVTSRPVVSASLDFTTADGDNLANIAYARIRESIIQMDLPPGAILSEKTLGASLGLSRTPIREALQRLEREYLVEIRPRRGITVTEVDVPTQLQLLEMRRTIEMRLITRGTERASERQRRVLAELADRMAACAEQADWRHYYRFDAEFDAQMDIAVANRFLTKAMSPVHALVRRFWRMHQGSDALAHALRQHAAMVRAASEGDPEKVRALLDELYDFNERFMLSLLS